MNIKLTEIDMFYADKHNHSKLNTRDQYLCLINNKFFAGRFSKAWFGWSFDSWYGSPMQFDEPGTNSSKWQAIWKIGVEK